MLAEPMRDGQGHTGPAGRPADFDLGHAVAATVQVLPHCRKPRTVHRPLQSRKPCTSMSATTPSTTTSAISAGTATTRRSPASRRARRWSSTRSIRPAGSSTPARRSPTSRHSTSARSIRSPVRSIIEGAQPGDAIKVTLLDFAPSGWGWTANIPGFGLLADQFKDPALHIWKYDASHHGAGHVRPRRAGAVEALLRHHRSGPGRARPRTRVVPPRRMGGNMDIRDMAAGTELYLPVEVAGGLFSVGDTHACPGRRRGLRHGDREPDARSPPSSSW